MAKPPYFQDELLRQWVSSPSTRCRIQFYRRPRRRVPDVTFEVEDEQPVSGDPSRLIFWASGIEESLEQVFRALLEDPSLTDFEVLSDVPERRLLHVALSSEGERGLTYIDAMEFGITLLSIELNGLGVEYRAQFPSREALSNYRRRCEERELSFKLRRLYRAEDGESAAYGVTPDSRKYFSGRWNGATTRYCARRRRKHWPTSSGFRVRRSPRSSGAATRHSGGVLLPRTRILKTLICEPGKIPTETVSSLVHRWR